jgi:hypothetical protein
MSRSTGFSSEDDAPPEVDRTDGTIWASGRDNLGGVVEEHFGGRVGDGEHRVPLRRIQAQLPGGPAARLGVVELEPEQALVVKDDVPEAGDDVAMRVRAAEDDGIVVMEAEARLREQVDGGGARLRARHVDEVVAVDVADGPRARDGDSDEREVGVRADDAGNLKDASDGGGAGGRAGPVREPAAGPGKWTQR